MRLFSTIVLAIGALALLGCSPGPTRPVSAATPPPMVSPATVAVTGGSAATVVPSPSPIGIASPAAPGQACYRQVIGRYADPDPTCTPGYIDGRVSPSTIASTICLSGYTATVRPPVSYTDNLRDRQMVLYGETGTNPATGQPWKGSDVEEDHLIPLEVGGNPTDPRNLWPEPIGQARVKDHLENELHNRVCQAIGALQLATAQQAIATDWVQAYHMYVGPLP